MKKIILLTAWLIATLPLCAQTGITFQDISLPEALAKAKQEKKLVFMDCYTSWCGPCKVMASTVFMEEEVGEYMNPRFVSVKYDMEKGDGVELAKKYGVKAYPTFVILKADGEEMHRIVGSCSVDEFIEKVDRGSNENTSAKNMMQLFSEGKISEEALQKALADGYSTALNSGTFNLYYENYAVLVESFGKEKVDNYLFTAWSGFLNAFYSGRVTENGMEQLNKERARVNPIPLGNKELLMAKFKLAEAALTNDREKIVKAYEEALPLVTLLDNGSLVNVFTRYIRGNATPKEDYALVADMYGKYLERLPAKRLPGFIEHNMLVYRKLIQTGVYFEPFTFKEAISWGERRFDSNIYVYLYDGKKKAGSMEKEVFPMEEAGKAIRAICVKYDLSTEEGKQLKEKFGVKKAPVHLMLNSKGEVLSQKEGVMNKDEFITWANRNETPQRQR